MLPADIYGMSFEYNQSAVGVSWCFSLGTGRLHTDVDSWAWACCWKLFAVTTLRGVVRMEIGAISATWLGEDYNYFASSDPHHDISKQLVDTTFV